MTLDETGTTADDSTKRIRIRGCRVHNLKNIDLDLPRGKLLTFCGLSGSGKTSLAIDTLYAEGQRCYIESFSTYTRQFLQRLDKPDCDLIQGIPPAIAVTRAGSVRTNRSTVATATEIADHVRLLFAKIATLHCWKCDARVGRDAPEPVAESIGRLPAKTRLMVTFPVWLSDRTAASEILLGLQQDGYQRIILGDRTFHLTEDERVEMARRVRKSGVECLVVVDRLSADAELERLTESIETAMGEGLGHAMILVAAEASTTTPAGSASAANSGDEICIDGRRFRRRSVSHDRRCNACQIVYPDPVPRLFNFNNPLGACSMCEGFGDINEVDMDLVVPDRSRSLRDGAIAPWRTPAYRHELEELLELAPDYDLPVEIPFSKLKAKHLRMIRHGVPERNFGGLDGFFAWLDRKKYKMHVRIFAARFRAYRTCPECNGKRLKPEALGYRIGPMNAADFLHQQIDAAAAMLDELKLDSRDASVAAEPVAQIRRRLDFLRDVGLGYLQLDRTLRTLSGGETQRVSLTSALGSSLVNMLYVLDEPTAGLHPTDVDRLAETVVGLRDRGNTVITVEHNPTMIRIADQVVEVGPGAGNTGGEIRFQGSPQAMQETAGSLTGDYLSGRHAADLRGRRRREPENFVSLRGAAGNNLRNVDVDFPLGTLCLVTGVSGSGKSTLVHQTLYPAIKRRLHQDDAASPLAMKSIGGLGNIEACELIDQSPISRSARSCPVSYVKAYDAIRKVFADSVDARGRGLTPGHFSFNSAKGRCEDCEGAGVLEIDMQFLADVSMTCPACRGTRFQSGILDAKYRDRSIADVLDMTASQAYEFFRGATKIQSRLKRMIDVGLEYITLGQSATTLSSGEAQRLKLAAFLGNTSKRRTLFLMDEPTTGLHFHDIVRLVECFDSLIADGHSLVVVEHNVMLMQAADYMIDIGPGAADAGGRVVATGTPEEIVAGGRGATAAALAGVGIDDT